MKPSIKTKISKNVWAIVIPVVIGIIGYIANKKLDDCFNRPKLEITEIKQKFLTCDGGICIPYRYHSMYLNIASNDENISMDDTYAIKIAVQALHRESIPYQMADATISFLSRKVGDIKFRIDVFNNILKSIKDHKKIGLDKWEMVITGDSANKMEDYDLPQQKKFCDKNLEVLKTDSLCYSQIYNVVTEGKKAKDFGKRSGFMQLTATISNISNTAASISPDVSVSFDTNHMVYYKISTPPKMHYVPIDKGQALDFALELNDEKGDVALWKKKIQDGEKINFRVMMETLDHKKIGPYKDCLKTL